MQDGLFRDSVGCFDNRSRADSEVVDEFVRLPTMWDHTNRQLMHFDAFWADRAEHCVSETTVRVMIFDGDHASVGGLCGLDQSIAVDGLHGIRVDDADGDALLRQQIVRLQRLEQRHTRRDDRQRVAGTLPQGL